MALYSFKVIPRKEWGPFFGMVQAKDKESAEDKVVFYFTGEGIDIKDVEIEISNLPRKLALPAILGEFDKPVVTMSFGEGQVAFGGTE